MNVNTNLREGTGNTKNINAKSGTLGKLARFLTVKQKANTNIAPSKRKMAQAVIKSNNINYRLPLSPKEQQILKNKMNINNRRIVVNKSNNSTNGAMATNNNNNNVTQRIKK